MEVKNARRARSEKTQWRGPRPADAAARVYQILRRLGEERVGTICAAVYNKEFVHIWWIIFFFGLKKELKFVILCKFY